MKLSDILEADVVDFGAKRKEKEFMDKVGAMSGGADDLASDAMASQGRDEAMAQELMMKYGRDLRQMQDFLKRPVMSGGFKTAYDLDEALKNWKRNKTRSPEKLRRRIQKAANDDNLLREIKKHNNLWRAINNQYPMEVIWNIPNVDDFEVLKDLDDNLTAAQSRFMGK